jgi:hypothetical protein
VRFVAGKGKNEKNTVDQPLNINVYLVFYFMLM